MICQNCGKEIPDNTPFCPQCGTPANAQTTTQTPPVYQQPVYQTPLQYSFVPVPPIDVKSKPDGMAIASMVLGICSILFSSSIMFGLACSILALIFSSKTAKNNPGNVKNKGFLTAGKICGIIGLIFTVFWIIFWIIFFVVIANVTTELGPYISYSVSY